MKEKTQQEIMHRQEKNKHKIKAENKDGMNIEVKLTMIQMKMTPCMFFFFVDPTMIYIT